MEGSKSYEEQLRQDIKSLILEYEEAEITAIKKQIEKTEMLKFIMVFYREFKSELDK